jgi:chromosomal replication initiation ATPase DnaA
MTNHATVLYAIRKVDDLLSIGDPVTTDIVNNLKKSFGSEKEI